jgi:alpha-galactosidase
MSAPLYAALLLAAGSASAPPPPPPPVAEARGRHVALQFNRVGHSRLVSRLDGAETPLGDYRPSEFVVVKGKPLLDFPVVWSGQTPVHDELGTGVRHQIRAETAGLRKEVAATTYQAFPATVVLQTTYTAVHPSGVRIDRWVERRFLGRVGRAIDPPFWSYQGASYATRPDWVLPVRPGFFQQNHLGMNASDYGGGTPVVDAWRKDLGLAVGHLERTPKLVSLPVAMRERSGVEIGIEGDVGRVLRPGESLLTPRTFVAVHRGDHFSPLSQYRRLMERLGVRFPDYGPALYEPIWCGWGYGRQFTPAQILATLPKAADLGFKWAVIDDGWQTAEGDWYLDPKKFPGGDREMASLTGKIREAGLKPMLWWAPLAVDPGTDLALQHPDFLLLGKDGKPRKITWWNAHYLCPAYPPVQAYTRELVGKMLREWGHDGLKLDGQHLNGAPPCYNPAHAHADPTESAEKLPEFFQLIHDTARAIKPEVLVELCPCGTGYAFHSMPFMNLPAASDPESSWQVRSKGKTLKALMGPRVPYFGDHVELSDGGVDFASTVGVGGVIGTQFTLPGNGPSPKKYRLSPEKERLWRKWVSLYSARLLSRGDYLGELYDIGYDRPEAHAIRKDGRMYYAFFARKFAGNVELRGLDDRPYCLRDYVEAKALGSAAGPTAALAVRFQKHLLVEAIPADPSTVCPE